MIRDAEKVDADAIAKLWSTLIRETAVTFNSVEKTEAEIAGLIEQKAETGLPFFVAVLDGAVLGFATYAPFRHGAGYAHTMEHAIMLAPEGQGRGLGRGLMAALEAHARQRGVHSLWAGVSAENPNGVAFHRHMGFSQAAVLPEVGYKFGRWMDLVLMVKPLSSGPG